MKNKHGFTLVELAVVLVIIGLLAGGILGGKNLIRIAELKTITTDFSTYQKAVTTFHDQYLSLPGDMYNATDMWGAANTAGAGGECASIETNTGTGTETCNGDGNGRIAFGVGTEQFRFWQHLANAELISGRYSGVQGTSNIHHVTGVNAPEAGVDNTGWTVMSLASNFPGDGSFFAHPQGGYGNLLAAGPPWTGNGIHYDAFLKPKELFKIDTKFDDGRAGTGTIMAHIWDDCTDAPNNSAASAEAANYLLNVDDEVCAIIFPKAF